MPNLAQSRSILGENTRDEAQHSETASEEDGEIDDDDDVMRVTLSNPDWMYIDVLPPLSKSRARYMINWNDHTDRYIARNTVKI